MSPVAALVLNIWIQLPGYAIAFMAVAAFIATFRDKIPQLQKLVWCIAVCGLFVVEIRAIRQDKEKQARIEKTRRDFENKEFADDVEKFDKALNALSTLKVEGELQQIWNNEIAAQPGR